MSYDFVARFDLTELTLEELVARLSRAMSAQGLVFNGLVRRQVEHKRWPSPDPASLKRADDLLGCPIGKLEDVPKFASRWWGVGLACVSQKIAQHLGRSDAMEVDLVLFQPRPGSWSMLYIESSTVNELRLEDEEAARELYALQVALASHIGFTCSIYDEQDFSDRSVVDLQDVRARLRAAEQGELGCSVIVSTQLMSVDEARMAAGRRSDLVRIAPGYLVFEYLTPDTAV